MTQTVGKCLRSAVILAVASLSGGGSLAAAEPALNPATPMAPGKGVVGVDPSHCLNLHGRPDIRVKTGELRSGKGNVRFVLYGDDPEEFLEKGKKLVRFEVPAAADGVEVCISAPHAGRYALAVLHDENGNHKFNITSDGGGFSNNPSFLFAAPSYKDAAFELGPEGAALEIELRYLVSKKKPGRQFQRR